jgi:prevent-host-death family protein
MGIAALRLNLGPIVKDTVVTEGRHIEVTDYGHPIAVVVPYSWYRHIKLFTDDTPEPTS